MAYYKEELIEEVISQNDIVEVISEYVTLKKRGRNYIGLCPFHREKTPSFTVSLDKQIFKCFGCGQGGNVISFIMKIENLEFFEAVEMLAERANIDLEKYIEKSFSKKDTGINKDLKEILFNINIETAKYFNEQLNEEISKKTSVLKDYLVKRKLDTQTIKKFGIGYSNEQYPLYDHLLNKGFSKEDILKSGIIIENDNKKIYNRFSYRLIFPIFDIRDRVIAFGGRVLDKSLPKYVNSPEGDIYSKGKNLYALNFAKREKTESIIIVEGYMDAVALHKSGFTNVVASLGTALTEEQAKLLKKHTDLVIVAYDQDAAGQDATLRGLDILSKRGLNVKVLKLDKEDAKDPDEYINKYGEERFKNCINNSISLVEFKISRLENILNLDNLDSKIKFLNESAVVLASIENEVEREIYVDIISKKYNISKTALQNEVTKKEIKINKNAEDIIDTSFIEKKMNQIANVKKRQEQLIIALILSKDKKIQEKTFSSIFPETIEDNIIKKIYLRLIELKEEYDINKIDIISKFRDEEIIKELSEIMYIDIGENKEKLLEDILRTKKKNMFSKRRAQIIEKLGQNITKDEAEVLQFELNQIILEIAKLK